MATLQYRLLNVDDAAVYRAHRLRGFREHPEAFTSDFEEESTKPLADTIRRLQSDACWFWGAFEGDALVGVVGLDREQRAKNRHKGVIIGMYVLPTHQGLGIARALLERAMAQAQDVGLTLMVLTVTEGNDGAERLYRHAGFVRFGVEPQAIQVAGRFYAKVHMACTDLQGRRERNDPPGRA